MSAMCKRLLDSVASLRMVTAARQAPERFDPPGTTDRVQVKVARLDPKLRARTKDPGEPLHFRPTVHFVTP
jgi:hypothetical protein